MTGTSWAKAVLRPKDYLLLATIICVTLCLPILGIISYTVYTLAVIVTYFLPNYGKFINYFDAWMEEDFVTSVPRNSVVHTLTLDGDVSLQEIREIFQRNVLNARNSTNPGKVRYPELKQFLTRFMGFNIWKDDANFSIENHIKECPVTKWSHNEDILQAIHHDMINRVYEKDKSPWEIVLVRNCTGYLFDDQCDNNNDPGPKSLLACRFHHVMADGKSLIKLYVEALGGKKLKAASSQPREDTILEKITFHVLFPLKYLWHMTRLSCILPRSHFHPWKVQTFWRDGDVRSVVAFTPKFSLEEVKQVAKRNGVSGSAVLMTIVAGGMRKCDSSLGDKEVTIGYPLPKPGHPETLTNYMYMGMVKLATNEANIAKRLDKCNRDFLKVKESQQGRYLDFTAVLGGIQMFPVTRLAVNQFTPTGITNLAGDEEGFSVGKCSCIDFRMTVGTIGGVAGVVFCAFSYKDGIRISVIAKESVLEQNEVNKLAKDISEEFHLLKDLQPSILH